MVERISAMTFHVCNSVVVFNGVKNGKISRLFIAVFAHGAFNMAALIINEYCGVLVTEAALFALASFFAYYIFKVKKGEI